VSRYQKGETNLDLLEQETVIGGGIRWAICKSAPHPRQITMPSPHHSVFTGRIPSCCSTNSVKAVEAPISYSTQQFLFSLLFHHRIIAFSALTLLVGRQEGHPACKKTEWWDIGVVVWDEVQTCI